MLGKPHYKIFSQEVEMVKSPQRVQTQHQPLWKYNDKHVRLIVSFNMITYLLIENVKGSWKFYKLASNRRPTCKPQGGMSSDFLVQESSFQDKLKTMYQYLIGKENQHKFLQSKLGYSCPLNHSQRISSLISVTSHFYSYMLSLTLTLPIFYTFLVDTLRFIRRLLRLNMIQYMLAELLDCGKLILGGILLTI